jgi:hypothetical protein
MRKTKLIAVKDAKGRFLDIVEYKSQHKKDLKRRKYEGKDSRN